jgi:hypothetical protein
MVTDPEVVKGIVEPQLFPCFSALLNSPQYKELSSTIWKIIAVFCKVLPDFTTKNFVRSLFAPLVQNLDGTSPRIHLDQLAVLQFVTATVPFTINHFIVSLNCFSQLVSLLSNAPPGHAKKAVIILASLPCRFFEDLHLRVSRFLPDAVRLNVFPLLFSHFHSENLEVRIAAACTLSNILSTTAVPQFGREFIPVLVSLFSNYSPEIYNHYSLDQVIREIVLLRGLHCSFVVLFPSVLRLFPIPLTCLEYQPYLIAAKFPELMLNHIKVYPDTSLAATCCHALYVLCVYGSVATQEHLQRLLAPHFLAKSFPTRDAEFQADATALSLILRLGVYRPSLPLAPLSDAEQSRQREASEQVLSMLPLPQYVPFRYFIFLLLFSVFFLFFFFLSSF